jgi:hypothetical protein
LYNIERDNPFEGRLLVYKVAKRVGVFPSEWALWKRFLQKCSKFFTCGKNSFLKFLKVNSFKVKEFGRKFFKLLRISTLKFEKMCKRKFFDSLKV